MCPVIYIRGLEATVVCAITVCAITVCAVFHAVRVKVFVVLTVRSSVTNFYKFCSCVSTH